MTGIMSPIDRSQATFIDTEPHERDRRLTLPPARPTTGIHNVLFLVCVVLYYGFARHLPFSALPYAFGARRVRYHVCRHMFRRCGRNVNVEHGAFINSGREVDIGDNSGIGLDAHIVGPLIIGRNVMMGPRCMFLAINHETDRTDIPMIAQGIREPTAPVIEDDVWLGANVTVLPGRRIGAGSIIGAGAVVAFDIPPFSLAAGNPARVVGHRGPDAARRRASSREKPGPKASSDSTCG